MRVRKGLTFGLKVFLALVLGVGIVWVGWNKFGWVAISSECEFGDADLCRFINNWQRSKNITEVVVSESGGEAYGSPQCLRPFEFIHATDNRKSYFWEVCNGVKGQEMYLEDCSVYIKDFGRNKWKKSSLDSDECGGVVTLENLLAPESVFIEPSSGKLKNPIKFTKVNEEWCGGLECLKYKVEYGGEDVVGKYLWFDTTRYLLRKQAVMGRGDLRVQSIGYDLSGVSFPSKQELSVITSDYEVAVGLLEGMDEVNKIRLAIEAAGNKLFFLNEGESNGEIRVEMGEGLSDHTSRIATFYVHVPTGVITVDDVAQVKRISLEEWKKQVRESWGF